MNNQAETPKPTPTVNNNIPQLIDSLEKISARLVESVTVTTQLASSTTPEVREMFSTWLECISTQILDTLPDSPHSVNLEETASSIGISPSAIASLILALHRQGHLKISAITVEPTSSPNTEICRCLS